MAKKNVDEIITLAKTVTAQLSASGEATTTSPEIMDSIQSVAGQIKRMAGADSDLAALVDQVQALAKDTEKK